jgi:hypothetical protein
MMPQVEFAQVNVLESQQSKEHETQQLEVQDTWQCVVFQEVKEWTAPMN